MKILTGVSWSKSTDLIDSSRWHLADFISICQSLYEGASIIKSFWIVYPWYLKEVTVLVLSFSGPASSCWTSLFYPIPLDNWFSFFHFGSVQFSSVAQSCPTLCTAPWTAARQASLSITNSRSSLKLMSLESVMPSNHLILCFPFSSCPQSFPASESFPMSQLFTWGGQSIRVSALASVLPMNTQDWSPLEQTSWISLQSKGLSRVFSNTTVQKHQFFHYPNSKWQIE